MKEIVIEGSRMMQVSENPMILISLKSESDFSTFSISDKESLLSKHFNIDAYRDFQQSHGINIFGIDEVSNSFDGFYTDQKKEAYGIKTADCIPLILWNPKKFILFGLHCGWRGLLGGIVEKALSSKAGREVTHAFIGPHISCNHFEVQQDFIETFISSEINIDKFITKKDGKSYMNLRSFCEQKLIKFNVKIINESSPCSYENSDSFFSWRRDKEKSLRNVCLTWF